MATSLPNLMRRALAVPFCRKLIFLEALARISTAWVMIRLLPYRLWRRRLGVLVANPPPEDPLDAAGSLVVDDVAWAHRALQRLFGTGFTCLMLAVSARDMLARRGVESRIILGIERKPEPSRRQELGAHAWVKSGNRYIVGQEGSSRFTPVAVYQLI